VVISISKNAWCECRGGPRWPPHKCGSWFGLGPPRKDRPCMMQVIPLGLDRASEVTALRFALVRIARLR
jgi:hypothetical protein